MSPCSPICFHVNRLTFKQLFLQALLISASGILCCQLELCGGLTPILERSARASCDDTDSHTQVSLLAKAEEPNTNSSNYSSEENSIIQPHYNTTVCHKHLLTLVVRTKHLTQSILKNHNLRFSSVHKHKLSCTVCCIIMHNHLVVFLQIALIITMQT